MNLIGQNLCKLVFTLLIVFINYAWGANEKCIDLNKKLPGNHSEEKISKMCESAKVLDQCESVEGRPIYHFDKLTSKKNAKKILVLGLIHGDEGPSGTLISWWTQRLDDIEPSNSWRLIPVSNPDGFIKNSRLNANGIDINRNFPTHDWDKNAMSHWKLSQKSNPRRFPGNVAGSEKETLCIMKHIEEFKPDFVISAHTPYAVLDFDGPKVQFPKFKELPWQTLGNFPGSLGRFMWVDRKTPVLTVELRGAMPENHDAFLTLQDLSGQVAKLSSGATVHILKTATN